MPLSRQTLNVPFIIRKLSCYKVILIEIKYIYFRSLSHGARPAEETDQSLKIPVVSLGLPSPSHSVRLSVPGDVGSNYSLQSRSDRSEKSHRVSIGSVSTRPSRKSSFLSSHYNRSNLMSGESCELNLHRNVSLCTWLLLCYLCSHTRLDEQ